MDWIYNTWPWYVAGPLIALVMFLLLIVGKQFGMSANLRTACAAVGGGKAADFFRFNWKEERWNLMIVLGAIVGGFIASNYMGNQEVQINPDIAHQLEEEYNFTSVGENYLPEQLFGSGVLDDPYMISILLIGGLLVGFGARYAGGCTSGHAISGLSNLQVPSLLAVIGFFAGGILMIHLIFPLIF